MTNDIILKWPSQDVLPPITKAERVLHAITNGIYIVEHDIQTLHESDLNDIRRAKIVTEDGSVVSGVQAFMNVAKYVQTMGRDLQTMADNMRFKCTMLNRRNG